MTCVDLTLKMANVKQELGTRVEGRDSQQVSQGSRQDIAWILIASRPKTLDPQGWATSPRQPRQPAGIPEASSRAWSAGAAEPGRGGGQLPRRPPWRSSPARALAAGLGHNPEQPGPRVADPRRRAQAAVARRGRGAVAEPRWARSARRPGGPHPRAALPAGLGHNPEQASALHCWTWGHARVPMQRRGAGGAWPARGEAARAALGVAHPPSRCRRTGPGPRATSASRC